MCVRANSLRAASQNSDRTVAGTVLCRPVGNAGELEPEQLAREQETPASSIGRKNPNTMVYERLKVLCTALRTTEP